MSLKATAPQTTASADASYDAVVIVPGIMGSELVDATSGDTLWGFSDLAWYVRAWTTGAGLRALHLTDDEKAGRYGRVKAKRLLRFPAFGRVLAGFEPYTRLAQAVHAAVVHNAAVLEFPYDWRLPVAHNARLLSNEAAAHLNRWRAHPAHEAARRRHSTGRAAQLVFVAHSMGGLLVRYLSTIPSWTDDDVRLRITLGTPFFGSVKAAMMLNCGRGGPPIPLPRRRPLSSVYRLHADQGLRALAASLPGVHDLVPTYRCLDEGASARVLTIADIVALGGDEGLARDSALLHERLLGARPASHRAVVGVAQPTWQSLSLRDGVVAPHQLSCEGPATGPLDRVDRSGDGTVYRDSATLSGAEHAYVPQQHGSLARTDEAIALVRSFITERDRDAWGPPMGEGEIGLDLPDLVDADDECFATITGITHPSSARCAVIELVSGVTVDVPRIGYRDGHLGAVVRIPRAGLYRVEVAGGAASPVSQVVLVADGSLLDVRDFPA